MFITFIQVLVLGLFSFADCQAPDESTLPEGGSMTYYKTEFKPKNGSCESLPVVCHGGVLSIDQTNPEGRSIASINSVQVNDYKYISCLDEVRCSDPRKPAGEFILAGTSIEAYKSTEGPCEKETRTCDPSTGELSGSYRHEFCQEVNQ